MKNIEQTILGGVLKVAKKNAPDITSIAKDDTFADLALTSLNLAQIIVTLEMKLDMDPFAEQVGITSMRSAGDLCKAYQQCLQEDDSLQDSHDRGALRRQALARGRA